MRGRPDIVAIIGRGGRLSQQVAEAVTLLAQEAANRESPHEFETRRAIGIDGLERDIRIFPPAWLRRLERAVDVGAFAKKDAAAIVQRILTTDAPEEGT